MGRAGGVGLAGVVAAAVLCACSQRQRPPARGGDGVDSGAPIAARDGSTRERVDPRVPDNPDAVAALPAGPGPQRLPVVATACALDRAGKPLGRKPRGRVNETLFFSRPDIRSEEEEKNCVPFSRLSEFRSAVFGKVVGLQDVVKGMCHSPLHVRTYVMGEGIADACGSVVYKGENAIPRFSVEPDPLHGTESAIVRLTIEDHRGRAKSCPAPPAAMVLHEEATVNGKQTLQRTLYASSAKPVTGPSLRSTIPVCAFFAEQQQAPDREPRPCEVGTYFLEDDSPFGKIVELRDWVDVSCPKRQTVALGRRLYVLDPGKSDACGSIHYGIGALEPEEGYYPRADITGLGLKFTYALGIIDNRFRKRSLKCPPATSRVELVERAFNTYDDHPPVLERRFYAPRADK